MDADLDLLNAARRIVYKRTRQEDMALFVLDPIDRSRPAPAVLYFTGGGWREGLPHYMIANAAWLRDHGGFVGIAVDYRVRSRHGTSPLECVMDARSAARFVRANAAELGIDPNRIVLAGGSAGAHITACTVLESAPDDPADDRSISPRADALLMHNPVVGGPGFEPEFFMANPEISPMRHIAPGWPPTILSHGTIDDVTPYADSVAFVDRMRDAGNACELITIKGVGHSCDWPSTNPHFEPTMQQMLDFLRAHGLADR